jgi:hypothetical protein
MFGYIFYSYGVLQWYASEVSGHMFPSYGVLQECSSQLPLSRGILPSSLKK